MIDRDVKQAEWYRDANASRLFHHLAYSVFYVDGSIYKQGQCRFSVAELSSDLSLTGKQIRTAIEKLERYGVIKTETASKKSIGTLFTILKYVNFAKNEKANGVANERANAFNFQSNQNQSLTSQFSETMANEKANGVANERANQYENNIYREEYINNISSTSSRACVTADFDEMKGESGLIESIMMLNHVDQETVFAKIDEFKAHCIAGMKTFVSKGDLRTHFRDWVRIRIQAEKQSKQQNNGVQAKYDPTGSYEPKSTREDYFL